jgi:glycogen operon protein
VTEYHVDGFRFDLGATLGRETYGFDPGCGLFDAMLQDPTLAPVKLISEAWDIGPGGYQVGNHPAGMTEWNDRFRDDMRAWWLRGGSTRGEFAQRLCASSGIFQRQHRLPAESVNYVVSHDGFTLEDLVSYNAKHNEANGEDNRDGSDRNESYNWGVEGPTDDEAIRAIRLRTKRNLLASLLFSHGTPMLLAGDEFGQTQGGNNNAYCQDNEISWLDWTRAHGDDGRAQREFVARLIALRRTFPALQGRYFQHGHIEIAPGLLDIAWFDERGTELTEDDWNNSEARLLGLRRAAGCDDGRVEVLALLANADNAAHVFRLPEPRLEWQVALDTADPGRRDVSVPDGHCEVGAHSLMLLVCRTTVEAVKAAAVPETAPLEVDPADGVIADAA